MTKKSETPNFETAMSELETLVAKIETGNLSLEESLKEFEQGIKLSRICQQALTDAEQRVKILTDSLKGETEEDFHISG
jgi:exodeoxyribonuclease VII small subunit